jgi:hypothetical protein
MNSKRKLILNRETVRTLSSQDMANIAGGRMGTDMCDTKNWVTVNDCKPTVFCPTNICATSWC